MLDFEARMVALGKHKVSLLVNNFSGHQIPTIGSRLCITQLKLWHPTPLAYFNPWMQE